MSSEFKKLFEKAPGLCIVLRPDLTVVAVSDAYLSQVHTAREDLVGRNLFDGLPHDCLRISESDAGDLRQSLERVLKTRTAEQMPARKFQIPRPKDLGGGFDIRFWGSSNIPILTLDGEIEHIILQVEDITSRVFIEQERDAFFAHSFDILAVVGTDGYFKRVNPAFEKTTGYTEDELYAQPIEAFLHPDDIALTKRNIDQLAAGVSRSASINRYRCKDGTYKWISWNTNPVGVLLYTVGRDITEQVYAEARIRELNSKLAEQNEQLERKVEDRIADLRRSETQVQQLQKMDAIGRLAGGIAHDFNNLLGAISLYSDVLLERPDRAETVIKNAQNIKDVTVRAAALTKQLSVFSRNQVLPLKKIALNPLVQNMETMLARLIGSNVKISMKLAKDLWQVWVDPSQIEQVILNLVVNARDAMPIGGTVSIQTSNVVLDADFVSSHLAVRPGNYIMLSVADQGTGMDEETLSKIFEPFFTTKSIEKGTGLGLPITYGIIQRNNGAIYVYSEPNKGTILKIYLPAADSSLQIVGVCSAKSSAVANETILLTDDNNDLRESLAEMLEKYGFKVLTAKNGNDAASICENHSGRIHLLLTDMVMPGMTGLELAKKAMQIRPDVKVVFMSGFSEQALEKSGIANLAEVDFIQKPFNVNDLATKIQGALNRPC